MESVKEKGKILEFGSKVGGKEAEIESKVSETANLPFEILKTVNDLSELEGKISADNKEKALGIIEAIKGIDNYDKQEKLLEGYIKSNDKKEIIAMIISAVKFLSLPLAMVVIVKILMRNKEKII
jgi:hypothetical protein